MGAAYRYKVEYGRNGKPVSRERFVGGIVVWGIVALVAIATGYRFLPPAFWNFFGL